MPKFVSLEVVSQLPVFFPLLKELRPHLDLASFTKLYAEARSTSGYQILGIEEHGELLALMGYRILTDFVHGRHLYIDDLITAPHVRSRGLGAMLLQEAERIALDNGCQGLRLCTGIDNEAGKRFYEKNLWQLRAVAFKKKLS
jgi:ribosomal protein S18 acetylase RimI-like enzyme